MSLYIGNTKGMFGWVDFRDDGKIKREKMGEKTFFVGI